MNEPDKAKSLSFQGDRVRGIRNKRLRILLIDNDDRFRNSMSRFLKRKYGVGVTEVESGLEALDALKGGDSYDIIFLDIMMPRMNGIESYHELRKVDRKCRIVMMSAFSDSKEWEMAELLHIELIHKPITDEVLSRILESVTK